MTSGEIMRNITAYFGGDGKPYRDEVVAEIAKALERLGDDDRGRIWSRLVEEERASFKIGVKEIVAACQYLGIGYHQAKRLEVADWECDACGRTFKYYPVTSHEDHIEGIFDYCPRCGFQPDLTKTRLTYAEKGRLSEPFDTYYRNLCEHHRQKYALGTEPFWSPSKDKAQLEAFARDRAERLAVAFAAIADKTIRRTQP
jgi:hypothetical protein